MFDIAVSLLFLYAMVNIVPMLPKGEYPPPPTMLCLTEKEKTEPCLKPLTNEELDDLKSTCGYKLRRSQRRTRKTETTNSSSTSLQIENGQLAEWRESPWSAGIIYISKSEGIFTLHCSAVIISKRHLLSSAHCFYNETEKKFDNRIRLAMHVAYGNRCLWKVGPECGRDYVGKEERRKIAAVYYPKEYKPLEKYDFVVLEVDRPFNMLFNKRSICFANAPAIEESSDKRDWIQSVCDPDVDPITTGYSGIHEGESLEGAGILRKFSATLSQSWMPDDLLYTISRVVTPGLLPSLVGGDSGGPYYCRLKPQFSVTPRFLLLGNSRGSIEDAKGQTIKGESSVVFTPQYGDLICQATNACIQL